MGGRGWVEEGKGGLRNTVNNFFKKSEAGKLASDFFKLLETCREKPKSLNTYVSQINVAVEIIHVSSKYNKSKCLLLFI